MIKFYSLAVILFLVTSTELLAQAPLRLWYDKPASQWEENIPLGNGRLGMMPDGNVTDETITLNEITLWSGAPQDANNYKAQKKLPEIRRLLMENKNEEAQEIVNKDFICTGKGSGEGNGANVPFGCYQILGNLHLKYDHSLGEVSHYERSLSLDAATAICQYRIYNVTYTRQYFTGFGSDVGVIRLSADQPGKMNVTVSLDRPEKFATHVEGSDLVMSGQLENGIDGKGMQYVANVRVKIDGGKVEQVGDQLVVKKANEIILLFSASTTFKSKEPESEVNTLITNASKTSFKQLLKTHVIEYQDLFNRMQLTLGTTNLDALPTNKRLANFQQNPSSDVGLAALYFQFGRYLSICSTRKGLLPPNLQGLWANQIQTPWNGDYHLDINIQMNQWPVEVTNLSELNLPLAELVKGMVASGERTAKAYYNADGWVAHVITNVWGYTEPGESASWGISKVGSGWICNNLWEHYAFTNDEKYLADIYPVLKGAAEFYSSMLVYDPETRWLVTSPSSSPEHGFFLPNGKHASVCIGPTIDNQIMHELFSNVISAAEKLNRDADFVKKLKQQLKEIPPVAQVAPDGRIMEWLKDYKELEPQHRCISHLYGLFPASLITPGSTPYFIEACKKTLEVRGDDGPSFSIAHKMLWWSRLHDGNRAYKLFTDLVRPTLATHINYGAGGGIYPNLFSAGPPFQIDGNFGATAGIAEMLIQSHAGFVELLPALPSAWKSQGEVRGLKARGNFTVDMKWKNSILVSYKITSPTGAKVKVKVNGEVKEIVSVKE